MAAGGEAAPAPAPPAASQSPATGSVAQRLGLEIAALQALIEEGQLPKGLPLQSLFEIDLADEEAVQQRVAALQSRPANPAAGDDVAMLRARRDALRLRFLGLPVARRQALLEQERLAHEAQALADEKARSQAAQAASEQARDAALATARAATDSADRTLAIEQARLLAHASELSAQRQAWVDQDQAELQRYRTQLQHFGAAGPAQALAPAQADALYAEVREALRQLRAQAGRALEGLDAPSVVRPLPTAESVAAAQAAASPEAVQHLLAVRANVAALEATLINREREARYSRAEQVMNALTALQARRIALLPALSDAFRRQATGFNPDGLERVLSEVSHLRLMARWYPVQRQHQARGVTTLLEDVFLAGQLGASLAGFLLGAVIYGLAYRRSRPGLARLRAWLLPHVTSASLRRVVDGALQMLIRIVHELLLLLAVYAVFDWWLADRLLPGEVRTLRRMAYAYALYRLAMTFFHRIVLVQVSRYHVVEPALGEKIRRSVRLVARLGLGFVLYLILAEALLGRGALYGIAREVALLGGLGVGWRLIRAWRGEVTQAYLSLYPAGRLADRVRGSATRSWGLLVALAAFFFVAARGLWIWLRDTALRFEQTRKALAYLFRRQLERQSRHQTAPNDPEDLPAPLLAALTEEPVDGALAVDVYPQLDRVTQAVQAMIDGDQGVLVALVGERGAGKTSWLLALRRALGDTVVHTRHTFERRDTSAAGVCRALSQALGLPACDDPTVLIDALLQGPRRVVLLDLVQNVMLRAVGGRAGHDALLAVAQATVSRVVWVMAYARWPFEYLHRLQPGRDVYDRVVQLSPWSEQQISALIDARMAACGFEADYDQLLLNTAATRLAQPTLNGMAEEEERNANRYHRLVWDYAGGNPRAALHCFTRSLVWTGGRQVTVRLFAMPSVEALEAFETHTWFVLSCVVQHENITVGDAAASLRFSPAECARALQLLQAQGFVQADEQGSYRVSSHWSRAVLRFLQRKKLLVV